MTNHEDLVLMCDKIGVATGVNLEALVEAAQLAADIVGHPLPGSIKTGGNLKSLRDKLHQALALMSSHTRIALLGTISSALTCANAQ